MCGEQRVDAVSGADQVSAAATDDGARDAPALARDDRWQPPGPKRVRLEGVGGAGVQDIRGWFAGGGGGR